MGEMIDKVLFMGSKQLGLRVLREIYSLRPESLIGVLTVDDDKDSRSAKDEIADFCSLNSIPMYVAKSRAHSEGVIAELKPEVCLVVCWYWIISSDSLASVPSGFIGIHNSLLPKYRGGSPLVWSIIKGEKEVGFSFFSFQSGIDDGAVWAQGKVKVESTDYISTILKKLEERTVEVLRDVYLDILECKIVPVEQNHDLATHCARRYPKDGRISWKRSAVDVYNFIRAQSQPYPGAFSFLNDEKIIVWKARWISGKSTGCPGKILVDDKGQICVESGDGAYVVLEEIQVGAKRGEAGLFSEQLSSGLFCSTS